MVCVLGVGRVRMNFTLSREAADRLREMCMREGRPMSRILEDLILGVYESQADWLGRELRERLRELGIENLEL